MTGDTPFPWRTLVTGGAGLPGSRLCERPPDPGVEADCADNLVRGSRENVADDGVQVAPAAHVLWVRQGGAGHLGGGGGQEVCAVAFGDVQGGAGAFGDVQGGAGAGTAHAGGLPGQARPTFVCRALAGEPLTVAGDGGQPRSLCSVDDTVDGILRAAASRPSAWLSPLRPVGGRPRQAAGREVAHVR
jgi:hypothetical protein